MDRRVFLALNLPAALREELAALQGRMRARVEPGAVRWVPPGKLHITIQFFGDIAEEPLSELRDRVPSLCASQPPFDIRTTVLGVFQNWNRPRVLWIGAAADNAALTKLHALVRPLLDPLPGELQRQTFHPHITLARFGDLTPRQLKSWRAAAAAEKPSDFVWTALQLALMESAGAETSLTYRTLEEFPFAEGGLR